MKGTEIIKYIINAIINLPEHSENDFEALKWLYKEYLSAEEWED